MRLGNVDDQASKRPRGVRAKFGSIDADGSRCRLKASREALQQRRPAGTVRAKHTQYVRRLVEERESVDDQVLLVIPKHQVTYLDLRHQATLLR